MRFNPDKRLIDLMVGQNVYNSPDVAMRELLQNAEDACALQQLKDPGHQSDIRVRYSARENWVSVSDNGLGMNQETIDKSFAAVGASKENVSHIRDLLVSSGAGHQIAYFGVGILSCFGVANAVSFSTKMDGFEPLSYAIEDYHDDWMKLDEARSERGTNIRLQLKSDGPMQAGQVPGAVRRHARHAPHVTLEDADTGALIATQEQWHGKQHAGAISIDDSGLRAGFLALHPAWDSVDTIPQVELVMCNAGFLVKERELGLLPNEVVGCVGELDVKPGSLTIQLNREAFQADEKWLALRQRLLERYNELIDAKVTQWEQIARDETDGAMRASVERGVLLLARGPIRGILRQTLAERLEKLIPMVLRVQVRGRSTLETVREVLEEARERGTVYYVREGEAPRQFQRSLQRGSSSIQVTETAQTESIRAMHLQLKGAVVLSCRQRSYAYVMGGGQQNLSPHEADLVGEQCGKAQVRFVLVNDATPEEVALSGTDDGVLFSNLLGLGEPIKLVDVAGLADPVIRDFAGRLLNCRNEEIREILRVLPDAVGSPVRRALLKIYMDIETWNLDDARRSAKRLLTLPDLADQAQLTTGKYLRAYLEEKIRPLIEPTEGKS